MQYVCDFLQHHRFFDVVKKWWLVEIDICSEQNRIIPIRFKFLIFLIKAINVTKWFTKCFGQIQTWSYFFLSCLPRLWERLLLLTSDISDSLWSWSVSFYDGDLSIKLAFWLSEKSSIKFDSLIWSIESSSFSS